MEKSDSENDHRRLETTIDIERDSMILKAGSSLGGRYPMEARYGAIYAGGGVHIGPTHRREFHHHRGQTAEPLRLKFSFDHAALAADDVCDIFHALQDVLGGGELDFTLDGNEHWNHQARTKCSSEKCKRE